jgi:ABC-2 type transport system permease protein
LLVGAVAGVAALGVADQIQSSHMPALWLNGVLLHMAFATISLAASISFDRLTPALGITLAVLLISYFFQVLGSLWPDADFLQPYSLFHYLQPQQILEGTLDPFHFALLAAVSALAIAYALTVFPRRDIAAPS